MIDHVMRSIVLAALCIGPTFDQDAGPGNKPVIENEGVTAWDVTWTKGQMNPARGHDLDAVVMWVAGPQAGKAFFSAKGRGLGVEAMLDGPRTAAGGLDRIRQFAV